MHEKQYLILISHASDLSMVSIRLKYQDSAEVCTHWATHFFESESETHAGMTSRASPSFIVPDALALLDEVQSLIDHDDETGQWIVDVKIMFADGRHQAAFTQAIERVEHLYTSVRLLPLLKNLGSLVQSAGAHIDGQSARLRKLEQDVSRLMTERNSAVEMKDKAQQEELLGQVAYNMSMAAEYAVYGLGLSDSFAPLSLRDINDAAEAGKLTSEQQRGWIGWQSAISQHVDLATALNTDTYLRYLRSVPAHGKKSASSTAVSDLKLWAGSRCKPRAIKAVQQYIDVGMFTHSQRPLTVESNGERVIQVVSNFMYLQCNLASLRCPLNQHRARSLSSLALCRSGLVCLQQSRQGVLPSVGVLL